MREEWQVREFLRQLDFGRWNFGGVPKRVAIRSALRYALGDESTVYGAWPQERRHGGGDRRKSP